MAGRNGRPGPSRRAAAGCRRLHGIPDVGLGVARRLVVLPHAAARIVFLGKALLARHVKDVGETGDLAVRAHRRRPRVAVARDVLRQDCIDRRGVEHRPQLRQAEHVLARRRRLLFRQDIPHVLVEHVLHQRRIGRRLYALELSPFAFCGHRVGAQRDLDLFSIRPRPYR